MSISPVSNGAKSLLYVEPVLFVILSMLAGGRIRKMFDFINLPLLVGIPFAG